jgi:hypothetical protein
MDDLHIAYKTGADGERHATLPDETIQYVKDFIRETSGKSAAEIAAVVQEGHDIVLSHLEGLSDDQARTRITPDDWSVLEAMAHVVTVKRIMPVLARSLASGELPPGFGPQLEEERAQDGVTAASFSTVAEAREAAEGAHNDLLDFIRGPMDGASLELRFKHFFFGPLNAREWACFQRIHDGDHIGQLTRIVASLR